MSALEGLSPGVPVHAREMAAAEAAMSALAGLSPGLAGHELDGPPGALDGMAALVAGALPPVPGAV